MTEAMSLGSDPHVTVGTRHHAKEGVESVCTHLDFDTRACFPNPTALLCLHVITQPEGPRFINHRDHLISSEKLDNILSSVG